MSRWRRAVWRVLQDRSWLMPALRVRTALGATVDARRRTEWRRARAAFERFRERHEHALRRVPAVRPFTRQRALIVGQGFLGLNVELLLAKAFDLAGVETIVLTGFEHWLEQYYRLGGVGDVRFWEEFSRHVPDARAHAALRGRESMEELLTLEDKGVRAGRYTASTALRQLRLGSLDLTHGGQRTAVARHLASALGAVETGERVLEAIRPQLVVFADRGYTPHGELFDLCLRAGIDVVTWNVAHRSNALILKRYTAANRDAHPASLSTASWEAARHMPWGESSRARIHQELHGSYATGDWYSEVGTQFRTRIMGGAELVRRLALDPDRKTAVIFPHILWDGTFFWGSDLFRSYEEWLLATVRTACANDRVNWIVKAHPGNLVKNVRDGVSNQTSELTLLSDRLGRLPPHVRLIPADTDISTFSLFAVADYCVTVRGTIGIEAATFGIPVLTAGTGRYDRCGFTIDSTSREEYLGRVAAIDRIPPLTVAERELAERFAYGVFVLRPLELTSVTMGFERDANASLRSEITIRSNEQWLDAADVVALVRWIGDRREEDFLNRTELVSGHPRPEHAVGSPH